MQCQHLFVGVHFTGVSPCIQRYCWPKSRSQTETVNDTDISQNVKCPYWPFHVHWLYISWSLPGLLCFHVDHKQQQACTRLWVRAPGNSSVGNLSWAAQPNSTQQSCWNEVPAVCLWKRIKANMLLSLQSTHKTLNKVCMKLGITEA